MALSTTARDGAASTVRPPRNVRPTPSRRRGVRDPLRPFATFVALCAAGLTAVPVVYVILGGLRTTGDLAGDPLGLPSPAHPENYTGILASADFWEKVANSTLIAGVTVGLTLVTGSMAAFALSRIEFPGREAVFSFFTLGLLFPAGVALLPLYVMLRQVHLLDSPLGVALPQAAFGLPTAIIILRPFMRPVPGDLEDASVMDGCSRFGFFRRILLPLCRPALLTVAVLSFVQSWNAFLLPLLVLTDVHKLTLPLGVSAFATQYSSDTALILAYSALSMVPALVFFSFAERRIVGGLTGAVKG
jgi:raffinose/stachyose/melibiose transport system permease protein